MVIDVGQPVPSPESARGYSPSDVKNALAYMGLTPGTALEGLPVDHVFIGSCTNGRLSDLREAAAVARGRKVAQGTTAWVVAGSQAVKRAAEVEGVLGTLPKAPEPSSH